APLVGKHLARLHLASHHPISRPLQDDGKTLRRFSPYAYLTFANSVAGAICAMHAFPCSVATAAEYCTSFFACPKIKTVKDKHSSAPTYDNGNSLDNLFEERLPRSRTPVTAICRRCIVRAREGLHRNQTHPSRQTDAKRRERTNISPMTANGDDDADDTVHRVG
ncbi:hypothetical protein BASA60_009726, partial [Batrachochytrium salamandrivorans]